MTNTLSQNGQPTMKRILIADDNQEFRRSTRLMLTLVPNIQIVGIAKDGREALKMAEQHQPDIALLDINMPGVNGLDAVDKMMERFPNMACIIVSAEQTRRVLKRAIEVGARGYLTKPFTADQLLETMEQVRDEVDAKQHHAKEVENLRKERHAFLQALAEAYLEVGRMDEDAKAIFAELAKAPKCPTRYLIHLAKMYALEENWEHFRPVALRLKQRTGR
mgnify:CR=1 FL=1